MKDSVLFNLRWNQNFEQLKEYGSQFINNDLAYNIGIKTGDMHVIAHRLLNDSIPAWIRDIFPLKPNVLQIFCAMPDALGVIHKDGLARKSTINIPITGYTNGVIEWFSDTEELKEISISSTYTQIRINEAEHVDRQKRLKLLSVVSAIVTAPSILNTDVWHRVNNKGNTEHRWILSIRFEGNPSFEDLRILYS